MDEKELPSSSDESDEDFVPKDEENYSDSGSEESDYETPDGEEENGKGHKRRKKTKKGKKKAKVNETDDVEKNNEVSEEKKEVDVDALWADFKKDVDSIGTKKTADNSKPGSEEDKKSDASQCSVDKNAKNLKRSNFSFPNRGRGGLGGGGGGGGLSKVLNQIGKKDKMSTLQKSQLDWNKFKKSEGIEEEIKMHNRGKDGYLEKQDFLQRTDLRQFEIEKDLRTARRKF